MPTIAYLGPEHTNTHVAALKRFGQRAKYVHAPTVDDVFHMVERQQVDYGVVPIENSLEGAVTHTLDRFIDFKYSPVGIHGEIDQPIQHCLITYRGANMNKLLVVYSHPQALAQCRSWLDKHVPNAHRQETNSTAEAVQNILKKQRATIIKPSLYKWESLTPEFSKIFAPLVKHRRKAAIARRELASRQLQAVTIPQERENRTRFLILGLGKPKPGKRNKTSILVVLKDRPGALYDSLVPFKEAKINLTKIESRPSKRKAWEYYFFIDLEGHDTEPRVKRALAALASRVEFLKILGSYPVTQS